MKTIDLARELYKAYCDETGWKSAVTGANLPRWEDTTQAVKDAWCASAAQAMLTMMPRITVSASSITPELVGQMEERSRQGPQALVIHSDIWDPIGDVAAFHEKFGLAYDGPPRLLDDYRTRASDEGYHESSPAHSMAEFRRRFLKEEAAEYATATYRGNHSLRFTSDVDQKTLKVSIHLADALDALIDTIYVALGNAYLHGFTADKFTEAWRRVHGKNMEKVKVVRVEESARGSIHDVIKPPGWLPPDHRDLVKDHIHQPPPRDVTEHTDVGQCVCPICSSDGGVR